MLMEDHTSHNCYKLFGSVHIYKNCQCIGSFNMDIVYKFMSVFIILWGMKKTTSGCEFNLSLNVGVSVKITIFYVQYAEGSNRKKFWTLTKYKLARSSKRVIACQCWWIA